MEATELRTSKSTGFREELKEEAEVGYLLHDRAGPRLVVFLDPSPEYLPREAHK